MKSFTLIAVALLAIGFTGILVDYTPNQPATLVSYLSCVPLAVGVIGLVVAGIVNRSK
ncbi:hypothetical protein ACFQT0_19430 [Hymenobacter humi]|uniref:DUF3098 domain-containing protein n=1 Tax=Hymenobacter humi TaxID=1411620 RepID=A0ABW2UB20_9BACT